MKSMRIKLLMVDAAVLESDENLSPILEDLKTIAVLGIVSTGRFLLER